MVYGVNGIDYLYARAQRYFSLESRTTMAKRAGRKGQKSEAIREMIKGGVKKPADIKAKLAERGIQVSTQMVYTVKARMSARRSARKISRQREVADSSGPPTNIRTLARFIRSVHEVGGLPEARKILKEMEE